MLAYCVFEPEVRSCFSNDKKNPDFFMYLFYFSMLATMAFWACLVLSGLGVIFVGICEAFIGVCFVDVFLAVSLFFISLLLSYSPYN